MPPIEPVWLPVAEVIKTNQLEVSETGERYLLREKGGLESACARPQNLWSYQGEEDVPRLAVALMYGIAKNHCFEQGNKRTAFTAAIMFIGANGYQWTGKDDPDYWGPLVIKLERGEISEKAFTEIYRLYVRELRGA